MVFAPSVNLNENHSEVCTDDMQKKMFLNGKSEQFVDFDETHIHAAEPT
jgi:hypothetical protein